MQLGWVRVGRHRKNLWSRTTLSNERGREMSNGFLSKIGRALSIFGVSNPDDVRKMQARKAPARAVKPVPPAVPDDADENSGPQKKRTEDE